ncbi:MAG: phage minor head protein [Verrucomicrobiota bacterium]
MNRQSFALISAQANRQAPSMTRRLGLMLRSQARMVAEGLAQGRRHEMLKEFLPLWENQNIQTKGKLPGKYAVAGYEIAGGLMGRKSYIGLMAAKIEEPSGLDVAFGADEIILERVDRRVTEWVAMTSRIETQTTAERYGKIIDQALTGYVDPETGERRGVTPRDLSIAFEQQALAQSTARSELMARTLTIWAYNEGAETHYQDAGITEKEWLTTEDDLTCPHCMTMDEQIVQTRGRFVSEGEEVAGLTVGLDTYHPPLHPHCRCALLPVL